MQAVSAAGRRLSVYLCISHAALEGGFVNNEGVSHLFTGSKRGRSRHLQLWHPQLHVLWACLLSLPWYISLQKGEIRTEKNELEVFVSEETTGLQPVGWKVKQGS